MYVLNVCIECTYCTEYIFYYVTVLYLCTYVLYCMYVYTYFTLCNCTYVLYVVYIRMEIMRINQRLCGQNLNFSMCNFVRVFADHFLEHLDNIIQMIFIYKHLFSISVYLYICTIEWNGMEQQQQIGM